MLPKMLPALRHIKLVSLAVSVGLHRFPFGRVAIPLRLSSQFDRLRLHVGLRN
jgi:hypothetical protein